MSERQLGPIVGATLLHQNIDQVISCYQNSLGYKVVDEHIVSKTLAALWNSPKLLGNRVVVLAAANGQAWLRVVEDPNALPATPLKSHGWMALETNVKCVDAINTKIQNNHSALHFTSCFKVIGQPEYLQVSDAIKAMQVIGPAGEVSYLTQVNKEVPPFELPMTTYETAGLFIPVLCTPDRDKSLAFYQALNNADKGLNFKTKITVLNNAWDRDIEHQYEVATLQLDGKCLIEIDQVPEAEPITNNADSLPSGISIVSCRVKNIENIAQQFSLKIHHIDDSYYKNSAAILLKGPCGELIELISYS